MGLAAREWKDVLAEHARIVSDLEAAGPTVDAMAEVIIASFRAGGRLYVLGNGGSAADAQHIAAELVGRFKHNRRPLPAVALTTNTSSLTAIANDLSFEEVFVRQIEALVRPGDVVWLISTSGTSPNVLKAAAAARERGAVLIGFTGRNGSRLAAMCRHTLLVPHAASDRIQEAHCLAYHYICERVEAAAAGGEHRAASAE